MAAEPRFRPHQLIEIFAYDGRPRDEMGEVYKCTWSAKNGGWVIYCRLFSAEWEGPRFRNFFEPILEAV